MTRRLILIGIMTILFYQAKAEEPPDSLKLRHRWGLFGHFNLNMHTADFGKLPGIPNCCKNFGNGWGTGFSAGVLYEHPLGDIIKSLFKSDDFYGLTGQIRLAYNDKSALLTAEEPTYVYYQPLDTALPGEFEHRLDATLAAVTAEPVFSYRFHDNFYVNLGFQLGALITKKFEQYEEITKPENAGTFLDENGRDTKSYIRNEYNGEIPAVNTFQAGIMAGLSYELPLNSERTLLVVPEVYFNMGLTKVVQGLLWRTNSFRAGIALKYTPEKEKPIIFQREYLERIDTITITDNKYLRDTVKLGNEKHNFDTTRFENIVTVIDTLFRIDTLVKAVVPDLWADINAFAVDETETLIPFDTLRIEEFISQKTSPLLNYVFFDENSNDIPERYVKLSKEETEEFSEEKLYKYGTLQYYYNILNIIGRRMNKFPGAELTLTSVNSGIGDEESTGDIYDKRSQTLKNYFTDVWDIEENRISTKTEKVTSLASSTMSEEDKAEEMRRVEITSNVWDIVKPVFSRDTIREYKPQMIRFVPEVNAEAGIDNWSIDVSHDGKNLLDLSGRGRAPGRYDWNVTEESKILSENGYDIDYYIEVDDKRGQNYKSQIKRMFYKYTSILQKQQERLEDVILGRYSLILFDFDKADITAHNKRIVDFIKKRITPDSRIIIKGYTDAIGEDDYNQRLSEARARAAQEALGMIAETVKGLGESVLLYDTDLPEGRFYCRTVEIMIETKVRNE